MKISEVLLENRYKSTIVVDVQPAYSRFINFEPELMNFLNKQNRILLLANAETSGIEADTMNDVKEYWSDHGFYNWPAVTVFDKGYGYLRNWMDMGISDRSVMRTIREMYKQKVNSSDQLFANSDDPELALEEFIGNEFDEYMLDDHISINWISLKMLKQFSGSYITGGGQNECLKEVELIMQAFNIRSTRIRKFIF